MVPQKRENRKKSKEQAKLLHLYKQGLNSHLSTQILQLHLKLLCHMWGCLFILSMWQDLNHGSPLGHELRYKESLLSTASHKQLAFPIQKMNAIYHFTYRKNECQNTPLFLNTLVKLQLHCKV